jgi:hypothetical protein
VFSRDNSVDTDNNTEELFTGVPKVISGGRALNNAGAEWGHGGGAGTLDDLEIGYITGTIV